MKNIVICCDGTGNEFGDTNSNVVKLYSTLTFDSDQTGYYHPGVGTMGSPNAQGPIEKKWTQLEGLAFGKGLLENVGDAYRYLMNHFECGDHIFLFGFSRGAYTVRALGGVIHMYGLLSPGNEGLIPYIVRMFAQKSRNAAGKQRTLDVASDFKCTFSRECTLHFVGVWDTVSSIAWTPNDPIVLPFAGRNPIMHVGRQALSIDERRCYYRDLLWGAPFLETEPEFVVEQDIKQVWFAGAHSDVGGSYPEKQSGLSKIALEWMLNEAGKFGLRIDPRKSEIVLGRLNEPKCAENRPRCVPPDPTAQIHDPLTDKPWYAAAGWWMLECLPHRMYRKQEQSARWIIPLGRRRTIPEGSLIHQSVRERMNAPQCGYHPPNLPLKYEIEHMIAFPPPEMAAAAGIGM